MTTILGCLVGPRPLGTRPTKKKKTAIALPVVLDAESKPENALQFRCQRRSLPSHSILEAHYSNTLISVIKIRPSHSPSTVSREHDRTARLPRCNLPSRECPTRPWTILLGIGVLAVFPCSISHPYQGTYAIPPVFLQLLLPGV